MVIAVDADGTLFSKEGFPHVGKENVELVDKLKDRQRAGDTIILWTCREGELVDMVVEWAEKRGLYFDAVNANSADYDHAQHKIVADIYIDDRGMTPHDFMMADLDTPYVRRVLA